ncbi:MAG TPA: amino acid permease [Verrucomicrobiae bacterium]|nr:amino acid permease [Verrucomicrobiae bacterium]
MTDEPKPHLERRFGLLQATALNMSNMIGIGPFITIPLLMSAVGGGPQAMLGWLIAVLIVIPDGMIWSELGAAMPGSGGTYVYLREGYGPRTWGRLMAFLFIWQFILSGPLEIASGYIGFQKYATYLFPGMSPLVSALLIIGVGALNVLLLYRRITSIGKITVALWTGVLITVAGVMVTGALNFDAKRAFDFPPNAFQFSFGFLLGLGAAARVGIYDYLGYYDICYIGDEVKNPGRVIPRSILLSIVGVALIYICINLSIIGVVPWREFVPAKDHPESDFIVSHFMQKVYGSRVASVFTTLILWTAFGSCFALLLGYSRILFAAARDGYFFRMFGQLHPKKNFPHVSLLLIGAIAIGCSFFPLDMVINVLLTTRILVQFVGQIGAVALLRKHRPDLERPYRIYLYPLPAFIALVGWIYLFVTNEPIVIGIGLATIAVGAGAFLLWSWRNKTWPFALSAETTRTTT